jgi:hypothetical protein
MAILAILAFAGFRLEAQSAVIVKLEIVKKPGAPDGLAMATVKAPLNVKSKVTMGEKTGHIATHARQAWIIMNGQGALLLLSPEKKGGQYQLRYYQLDEGKGRLLGDVPFAEATMKELQAPSTPWAFALAGPTPRQDNLSLSHEILRPSTPGSPAPPIRICPRMRSPFNLQGDNPRARPVPSKPPRSWGKKRLATYTLRAHQMRESPISSSFPTEIPSPQPQMAKWNPGAGLLMAPRFASLQHRKKQRQRRLLRSTARWASPLPFDRASQLAAEADSPSDRIRLSRSPRPLSRSSPDPLSR